MKKKGLAVGIILLFVGTGIIPSTAQDIEKPSLPISSGKWLYVGGSGSGNYTRIQDAINNANSGDTVFVYPGWYNESISINKSIFVYGAERDTTFIGGEDGYDIFVHITADNVEFKRFTIQKFKRFIIQKQHRWLYYGIIVEKCVYSQIAENCIVGSENAIIVVNADSVMVSNNIIKNNAFGIYIGNVKNTTIKENVIEGNGNAYGIEVEMTNYKNSIERNTITNNQYGILLTYANFTIVQENNFLKNKNIDAFIINSIFTVWKQNYWNRPHLLPKVILGVFFQTKYYPYVLPLIKIDWHPALKPYGTPD